MINCKVGEVGKSAALSYDLGEARMGTGGNNVPGVIAPYQTKIGCLNARDYKGIGSQYVSEDKCIVEAHYKVRRLTPTECERLQGLPDGYTLLDDKKCSDSARYKALGNGMAQPCADFVIRRIAEESRK